ncbi:helix-turn-helix domain-containing protein [Pedobacter cryoconitis]|uniref:helix-turn-helix domain-containing protein n=1 Tax=Pedobacter cryoconitis TaxID=188932 RepID=UPI001475D821|nr:helix-turn-helix domain-containing protein [Pedobacter cryoconitis]
MKRICEHCKGIFDAKTTVTRFCSAICNKRSYKIRLRVSAMKNTDQEVQTILEKPMKSLQGKDFLSVSNAAKLLSTSTKMIYRMISDGKLAAVNLSVRKTVISRKEIDRLFEIKEQVKFSEEKIVVRPKVRDSYSMAEAQKKFKISEAGLYQLIKRHKISKFKNGWYTYVAKKDLDVIFNNGIK